MSGAAEVEWRDAAAYVVCRDHAARVLLARFVQEGHPDSGRWTLPGGGMHWGEDAAATARRELEEETGPAATVGRVMGIFSRWYDAGEAASGRPGHVLGIVHEAGGVTGELRAEVDGTTDAVGWFTLEEVRALPRVELVDLVLSLLADAGGQRPGRPASSSAFNRR